MTMHFGPEHEINISDRILVAATVTGKRPEIDSKRPHYSFPYVLGINLFAHREIEEVIDRRVARELIHITRPNERNKSGVSVSWLEPKQIASKKLTGSALRRLQSPELIVPHLSREGVIELVRILSRDNFRYAWMIPEPGVATEVIGDAKGEQIFRLLSVYMASARRSISPWARPSRDPERRGSLEMIPELVKEGSQNRDPIPWWIAEHLKKFVDELVEVLGEYVRDSRDAYAVQLRSRASLSLGNYRRTLVPPKALLNGQPSKRWVTYALLDLQRFLDELPEKHIADYRLEGSKTDYRLNPPKRNVGPRPGYRVH